MDIPRTFEQHPTYVDGTFAGILWICTNWVTKRNVSGLAPDWDAATKAIADGFRKLEN